MKDSASEEALRRVQRPVSFWGRLEVRIILSLALLGTLCVGASAYLVQLAVDYFDARVGVSLGRAQELADDVEPFHHALIETQISAYRARTRAMALELEAHPARAQSRVEDLLGQHEDLVVLRLELADGSTLAADREREYPADAFEWYDVIEPIADGDGNSRGQLQAVFRIDPSIDARYQALGEKKRELGAQQEARGEVEAAVESVLGIASGLVLFLALIAGYAVARTTTRKATELSRVMTRVARGELEVRSTARGGDELGRLSEAFNTMLDELARAQDRVAYLQRIGAWQEMARRIAHEIKNPLTPILLSVQQIRDKDPQLNPAFSKLIATSTEIVEDEVRALRRMVTSFSQFAKVPQVRLEPVGLSRVLEEFERAYGHLTDEAQDVLTVVAPPGDPEVLADRQLLKQVLVNLVENAVLSAREAGRSPVCVEVHGTELRDAVEIRVDDNGPGIAEDRRLTVFEPYETTRETGTGLGLAIVKKIVLDHEGEVSAHGSPLGGAQFRISLPKPPHTAD